MQYVFRDKNLLNKALTHSSASAENGGESNQRLEFLGDAVLQLCISEYIFDKLKNDAEGELSKIRSMIVCADSLAVTARQIGLDKCIILGKGEEHSGGRHKKNILADALESVTAAVYLDGGFDSAAAMIMRIHLPVINAAVNGKLTYDYKTALQEYVQTRGLGELSYELCATEGPEHDRTFTSVARVDAVNYAPFAGHNKKESEQGAARNALDALGYFDKDVQGL